MATIQVKDRNVVRSLRDLAQGTFVEVANGPFAGEVLIITGHRGTDDDGDIIDAIGLVDGEDWSDDGKLNAEGYRGLESPFTVTP
jgi:hypothetical protein